MSVLSSPSALHYRAAALCWTLGILAACLVPTSTLGSVSPLGVDKLAHIVLFAGFGALWMRGLCPPGRTDRAGFRRRVLGVVLAGVVFAGATEALQYLAPIRRVADPYDLLADLVGLASGVAAYGVLPARHRTRMERPERS